MNLCPTEVESVRLYEGYGNHIYRILYSVNLGYRVQRRRSAGREGYRQSDWVRSMLVYNFIQLQKFDEAWYARPVQMFTSLKEAENIIEQDMKIQENQYIDSNES